MCETPAAMAQPDHSTFNLEEYIKDLANFSLNDNDDVDSEEEDLERNVEDINDSESEESFLGEKFLDKDLLRVTHPHGEAIDSTEDFLDEDLLYEDLISLVEKNHGSTKTEQPCPTISTHTNSAALPAGCSKSLPTSKSSVWARIKPIFKSPPITPKIIMDSSGAVGLLIVDQVGHLLLQWNRMWK